MKEIYDFLFYKCSEDNQLLINDFKKDVESSEFEILEGKYNLYEDKNATSFRLIRKIDEKNFFFQISINRISFFIKSSFVFNYNFFTEIIYDIKDKSYEIQYSIEEKNKNNSIDYLFVLFENKGKKFNIKDSFGNLKKNINSKKSKNKSNELYILNDKKIIEFMLLHYKIPESMRDLLLLNQDIDIEKDAILHEIVNHFYILQKIKY